MADDKKEYGEVSGGTGGYESMVWVRDKDGKEYACYLKDIKGIKTKKQLTEEERSKCVDVSQIVGTERW